MAGPLSSGHFDDSGASAQFVVLRFASRMRAAAVSGSWIGLTRRIKVSAWRTSSPSFRIGLTVFGKTGCHHVLLPAPALAVPLPILE
jgi:hypothetical protein